MSKYISRIIDTYLQENINANKAVQIEGIKHCGKTTTTKHIAASHIEMDKPNMTTQYQNMAHINPSALLKGAVPHLIAEWQIAPNLWDEIRSEIDKRDDAGQFILTSSAVPPQMEETTHTEAEQIVRMRMRPMSLYESGDSSGYVSLKELFENQEISGADQHDIDSIAYLICRGGWPKAIGKSVKTSLKAAIEYYNDVVSEDISQVDNVRRDSERAKQLMKSYARNISTQAPLETIRADMLSNEVDTFGSDTLYSYLNALKRIFVVEDSLAWNPRLRSKTAIRTTDTRYFVDPSVATAALGLTPKNLVNDLDTMGQIFENLCVRDLRIYADTIGGTVYHYKDKTGLECDCVVQLQNGEYGLIEVKLGGNKLIEEGAANLKKLADKLDTDKMKKPSFMMILCGVAPFAYRRSDGILVVPIGCLKN